MSWLHTFQELSTAIESSLASFPPDRIMTLVEYQLMVWSQVLEIVQSWPQIKSPMDSINQALQVSIDASRVDMNHALIWESLEKNRFDVALMEMINRFHILLKDWDQLDKSNFLELVRQHGYWASNSELWKDPLIDAIFKEFTLLLKSFYIYTFWRAISSHGRQTWDNLLGEAVRSEKFPLTDLRFTQIKIRIDVLQRLFPS